jgi:hypothetical protein
MGIRRAMGFESLENRSLTVAALFVFVQAGGPVHYTIADAA